MKGQLEVARKAKSNCEDICLIARFLDGSEAAFEELFRKYQGRLFSFCRHFLCNATEAEDVVQDTFLEVYRGLKGFRGDSTFMTWLYAIASRKCMTRYRQLERSVQPAESFEPESDWEMPDLDRMLVRQAISELPDQYRMVLILKYYEQFSLEEMAHTLGDGTDRLKMRLHRARNALKDILKQQTGGDTL